MGFKCPKCHKDFGKNQEELIKHIKDNLDCLNVAKTSVQNRVKSDLKIIDDLKNSQKEGKC